MCKSDYSVELPRSYLRSSGLDRTYWQLSFKAAAALTSKTVTCEGVEVWIAGELVDTSRLDVP
jgi:hypothetical protein